MKILLTGSIALDRIMVYPGRFRDVIAPEKLHVLSISVLLDELRETRGGIAANIAYTLALLGEQPILYGSVGENARGYMGDLASMGIDVSHVHWSAKPTATFSVITDADDCQVGGFYPGAMGDASSLTIAPWKDDDVFVVISAHDPGQMRAQVAECAKYQKRLFYDVGQQVVNIPDDDVRAGISACELLIVNDYEMGVIEQKTGWTTKEICEKVSLVVITLGGKGSRVFHNGTTQDVAPLSGLKVVDPTGAGDAFRAGFLHGYIRKEDPVRCATLGSVAAAYAIETLGTQEHRFSNEEYMLRYEETYGKTQ